jgi:hypothetical protein
VQAEVLAEQTGLRCREILPKHCAAAMKALIHASALTSSTGLHKNSFATSACTIYQRRAVQHSKHPQQQIPRPRVLAVHAADPGHYGANEKVHSLLDLLHEVGPCKLAESTALPHPVARSGST